MAKYQEIQALAENFDEGNSELFANHNFRGRLYFAGSWTLYKKVVNNPGFLNFNLKEHE